MFEELEDYLRTTLDEVQTWRQALATIIEDRPSDLPEQVEISDGEDPDHYHPVAENPKDPSHPGEMIQQGS